jgi:energy-coupling factor transport system permease protein
VKDFGFTRTALFSGTFIADSPLAGLHPLTRLVAVVLIMTGMVASRSFTALAGGCVGLLLAYGLSGVPVRPGLRSLGVAAPLILIVAVLQILAIPRHDTGAVLVDLGFALVTAGDLIVTAAMFLRFAGLILLIALAVAAIPARDLIRGLETGLGPLARIGFPAHELALAVTVTLSFIPIVLQEAENLAKAQASRGADFGKGRGGLFKRVRRMLPLLVPLFLTALRRAENLVVAMEARCYTGGKGRTHLITHSAAARDGFVAVGALAAAGLLIAANPLALDQRVLVLVSRRFGVAGPF